MAVEEGLPCHAVINPRQQEPFKMKELPNGPQEHLQAKLFELFQSTEYVLVVQCLFSHFPAVKIITSISASAIIQQWTRS